jgi:predicted LPLAT superfamily acyltransferase
VRRWTAKAERGSTWLIRLIAWLARAAGRPLCRILLYPIVLYFVLVDTVARRASREFLGAATNRRVGWVEVFGHLYSFAATLLDRVYMATGDFRRFHISIAGDDLVHSALASGRGCLLLGSHLGSFDLLMLANRAFQGLPVNIMMHFDPRSRLRRIAGIDDSRSRIIPLGRPTSFLRAYELLEQGEIVAMLADRVDGSGASLESSFLGKPASFPLGPHLLAARAGVPVILFFGLYEGGADYRIEFAEFGAAAPSNSRRAMLQPVVDRYASLLEQAARRHPKNWFNFYPYWTKR